ncbi:dachshund homolog 1-like [Chenopodium quinoa]|uniref:dachshund homolog 1-like n=1 Tax=Chenopodium quinoa TaxID=63459 RepID=UPI000B77FD13|nr:dachshund homolog 1-like [Chenopodium quinoa]
MMDPVPSLNVAYAKVVSDERKQTVSDAHDTRSEAVGFAASGSAQGRTTSWSSGGDARVCDHCGKKGHEKEKCFDLVGWPESFNGGGRGGNRGGRTSRGGCQSSSGSRGGRQSSGGGRGFAANMSNNTRQSSGSEINKNDRQSAPTLTDAQWAQFLNAIKGGKPTNSSSDQTSHGPHFEEPDWSGGAV